MHPTAQPIMQKALPTAPSGSLRQGSREDVEAASAAAWEAFKTWKKTTPAQRAALLNKIADIIDANKEHLAMVESMDNGKPIRETMNVDIPMAAEHFRYFAGCILAEEGQASVLNEQFLSIICVSLSA